MLTLCNILKESQDKVSTAVEHSLRKQGINLDDAAVAATKLARQPTNQAALKAAALGRIEGLLTTVLDRLGGQATSPSDSPQGPSKSRNVTPQQPRSRKPSKTIVEDVPEPSSGESTPTLKAVDSETQTKPLMRDTSIQANISPPRLRQSVGSPPLSDEQIAAERERTMQKLESKQDSHWSADVSR
jgi:hypothetical protein